MAGIISTLIESVSSIISQYCISKRQEQREDRKMLADNFNEMKAYTESVDKAIRSVINFMNVEIIDEQTDGILNVINDVKKFTNECMSCWDNYRKIINTRFSKTINKKKIKKLDGILTEIDYITKRLTTVNFPEGKMPDTVVLRNQQEYLKKQSKDFRKARDINLKIKEKYLKLLGK